MNPVAQMRNAWAEVKTIYGKIGVALFYPLLWVSILLAIIDFSAPESQGRQCIFDAVVPKDTNPQGRTLVMAIGQGMNLFDLGFFISVHAAGFNVRNTVLVAIVLIGFYLFGAIPFSNVAIEVGCDSILWWPWPGWAVLASIFTILDFKLGDYGSEQEQMSLNV